MKIFHLQLNIFVFIIIAYTRQEPATHTHTHSGGCWQGQGHRRQEAPGGLLCRAAKTPLALGVNDFGRAKAGVRSLAGSEVILSGPAPVRIPREAAGPLGPVLAAC